MSKKITTAFLVIFIVLGGRLFAAGGQGKSGGTKEAAALKTYPSSIAPSGTAAGIYKEKLDYFSANFVKYFTGKGEADKVKGYDTPLTVNTTMQYSAGFQEAVSEFNKLYGETFDINRYTDAYKRAFNIDLKNKWVVPTADYAQQLRLDMAAGDLADIILVTNRYDLYQMAEAGIIQDLGPLKDTYTSRHNQMVWESDKGSLVTMGTFNGKFYGLPSMISHTDFFSYLWIRQDWLEALNLPFPKTLDELTKVIEAFVNADFDKNGVKDTIGMALEKGLYYPTRGIFSAYKAYPEIWELNKNGSVIWGGVNEANKGALAYLNSLYKKGLLDREFITYTGTDQLKAVINGKCGVVWGGHWLIQSLRQMPSLDPKVEWVCPPLPTVDGKPVNYPINTNQRGWTAVNSKFANPEVAYKMQSITADYIFNNKDCDWWWFEHGTQAIWFSVGQTNVTAFDNYNTYLNLMEAYKANDPGLLRAKGIPYWANLHSNLQWEWDRMFGPLPHAAMTVLDEAVRRNALFYNAFLGLPSQFMQDRWQSILDEQLVTFTKIVTGDLDVNAGFDAWVKTFNSMGGEQITREVNEWYKNNR
jgi:putative aldouronate transport system substrate-binding protein